MTLHILSGTISVDRPYSLMLGVEHIHNCISQYNVSLISLHGDKTATQSCVRYEITGEKEEIEIFHAHLTASLTESDFLHEQDGVSLPL